MNTPNPLMPQGALEAQATNKRSMIKIVVSTILAIHGVVLGGLLFLGCKEENPEQNVPQFADSGLQTSEPIDDNDDPFADFNLPRTDGSVNIPGVTTRDASNSTGLPPLPAGSDDTGFAFPGSFQEQPGNTGQGNRSTVPPANNNSFIPEEPVEQPIVIEEMTTYVVLPGDNFTKIANKHNLKASDISRANPGVDSRKLQVGQPLKLPPNVTAVTPKVPESGGQTSAKGTTYTVKSGDNLTRISKAYGVTIKALQDANNIKGSRINVGQKLVIPVPTN